MVPDRVERVGPMTKDEKSFFVKLGKRITELRGRQALTQTQLAERLGVSYQTVNSFEHGRRRVPVSMLPALAEQLSVSIEELVVAGASTRPASKRRGPRSKLDQQIDIIRELPRTKQKFVMKMLEVVITQAMNDLGREHISRD